MNGTRTCKVCNVEKEYNYLTLDAIGRAIYKDQYDGIWHGKKCYACHKNKMKVHMKKTWDNEKAEKKE